MRKITMLGAGLIGTFYTTTLLGERSRDEIQMVCSRTEEHAKAFAAMLNAADQGTPPMETFYDGYVVNAIIDACYASAVSKKWEPVRLEVWRGAANTQAKLGPSDYDAQYWLIKTEVMPDGQTKLILKDKKTGVVVQKLMSE